MIERLDQRPVQIRRVMLAACGYIVEHARPLARALVIPFVLYLLLDGIARTELSPEAMLAFGVLNLIVHTLFAIITHRVVLLGPSSVSRWGVSGWGRRESLFALYVIGSGFLLMPLIFLAIIPGIGVALAFASAAWLFSRISLVFPAIATDEKLSFGQSWQLTRPYQLEIFLVVVIIPALVLLPAVLLRQWVYTFWLGSFLSTLATVFTVTALSVAFKLISQRRSEQG